DRKRRGSRRSKKRFWPRGLEKGTVAGRETPTPRRAGQELAHQADQSSAPLLEPSRSPVSATEDRFHAEILEHNAASLDLLRAHLAEAEAQEARPRGAAHVGDQARDAARLGVGLDPMEERASDAAAGEIWMDVEQIDAALRIGWARIDRADLDPREAGEAPV